MNDKELKYQEAPQSSFGCRPCRNVYDPSRDWASWSWRGHRRIATEDQLPPVTNGAR